MKLSDGDRLKAAHYCAQEVVRRRRLTGEPIPGWLTQHYQELDVEIGLSASGHENSCSAAKSDTLSSVEVAQKLHKPERWVRRHPELLGGIKHGDRWRYSRGAVEQYASAEESA